MRSRRTFSQTLVRAFMASLVAGLLGSVAIGSWIVVSSNSESTDARPEAWGLSIFLCSLFLAELLLGTIATAALSPAVTRFAPFKTARSLVGLLGIGALCGMTVLSVVGLALRANDQAGILQIQSVLTGALILGSIFGGLTALGWWLQLPRTEAEGD